MLFDGKVALVTGAGGGIGLTTARAFAEAGASVILADNDAALLEEAVNGLRSTGLKVLAIPCDVRDRSEVRAMIAAAVETYGRLDAAFNNAGINCDGAPLLETDDDEFDTIIDVNLRGVWNCMKAELRQMTAQGTGAIVNCSSIGGMRGSKGRAALFRQQIRDYRPHARRRSRLCRPRHSHQRGVPGDHRQYADGETRLEEQRPGHHQGIRGGRTDRTPRRTRRNCSRRLMALQPSRELCARSQHGDRRRHSRVSRACPRT